jgi:hypothetical protein
MRTALLTCFVNVLLVYVLHICNTKKQDKDLGMPEALGKERGFAAGSGHNPTPPLLPCPQ